MELRVLKYFLAVAREKNITAAAEKLHLTQPTLSRQLMDLEYELGTQLFIRGKRNIILTDEGIFLRKRAQEIVDLADRTEADFHSEETVISGDVCIGGGETTGMHIVTAVMKQVHEKYPNIRFNVYSGDEEIVVEQLDKGLIDFGLFVGTADLKKYNSLKLPTVNHIGLLMKKDDCLSEYEAITPNMLYDLPLICSRQMLEQNEISGWLGCDIKNLNIVGTYNLLYNASLMVEDGIGYALCIDRIINKNSLCYRPLDRMPDITVTLAWQKYQAFSKPAKIFLEFLKDFV